MVLNIVRRIKVIPLPGVDATFTAYLTTERLSAGQQHEPSLYDANYFNKYHIPVDLRHLESE